MQKSQAIEKPKEEEPFTIIIGGNEEKDLDDFFSGKSTDQPKDVLYLDTFEQLHELLSPKKLDLLKWLMDLPKNHKPCSVSDTAKKIKRKQEAVSRDLKQLKKLGLVELKKDGQKTIPTPKFRRIEIIVK
ncbi:MAG: ArsR family transcriptional regulator [Candidatus Diapherotrites archaeon]|nr:ArsR family transcriptional regulator [Candidatus Diapherotrites archaeon]